MQHFLWCYQLNYFCHAVNLISTLQYLLWCCQLYHFYIFCTFRRPLTSLFSLPFAPDEDSSEDLLGTPLFPDMPSLTPYSRAQTSPAVHLTHLDELVVPQQRKQHRRAASDDRRNVTLSLDLLKELASRSPFSANRAAAAAAAATAAAKATAAAAASGSAAAPTAA